LQKCNIAFINIINDSPDQPVMHLRNINCCIFDSKWATMASGKPGWRAKTKGNAQQNREFMGFRKNFLSIGIAGAITLKNNQAIVQ